MPRHIERSRRASAVALAMLAIALAGSPAAIAEAPRDPLQSGKWADLVARLLGDRPVVMDERVKVHVPSIVENQAQVPVSVDARAIDGVSRLVVFADYNPIEHVLTMSPAKAEPYVGFRMKVEQGTPVRAAALGADGTWHVGWVFLEAAGGGCSSPALARRDRDWSATVGQAQGRVWRQADGSARVRIRVRHPMDTGLGKDNTPPYYIETVTARGAGGEVLATLETLQPVGEDPTLTLIVRPEVKTGSVEIESRDNNGGLYHATIAAALTE
jgi:sulfur-oxidizing protein SoxY